MFYGLIKEYPDAVWLTVRDGALYFQDEERIRRIESGGCGVVFRRKWLEEWEFGLGGLWVQCRDENFELKDRYEFVDLFGTGKSYEPVEIEYARFFIGQKSFGQKDNKLFAKDFEKNEKKSVSIRHPCFIVSDGNYIFGSSDGKEFACFDIDLNELWNYPHDKWLHFYGNKPLPTLWKNLCICNLGSDRKTKKNGEIVALEKETGRLVWRRLFENEASKCLAFGDRLYVASAGRMIVLDAATGEILLDEDSGFEKSRQDEVLWTDGEFLCMVNPFSHGSIRVFSGDGKRMVQELRYPDPYLFSFVPPVKFNDSFYCSLPSIPYTFSGVRGALLKLRPVREGEEPGIHFEKWPEHEVKTVKEGRYQAYHVFMKDEDPDRIFRYGVIKIREIAAKHGFHTFCNEDWRDKKFNGNIYFTAPVKAFGSGGDKMLEELAHAVDYYVRSLKVFAGNRKGKIKLEIVPAKE